MNELQKANELKEKWNSPYLKPDEYSSVLTEAKTNLEGLGCGKDIDRTGWLGIVQCGNIFFNRGEFCNDCLFKSDKAKEIYEEILK
jgi:hypothetical protein